MTSNLRCLPLTSSIGAVIEGIDIGETPSPETTRFVRQSLLDRGVIFLRDQHAPLDRFWDFLTHFGIPLKDETTGTPQDTSDMVATNDMSPVRHTTATWHADTTSLAAPPWATALRAVSPPPFGGDTCWASMTAAFAALSEPMQRMLDGLTAVHSIQVTYDRMLDYAPLFQAQYAPLHPAEQVHPVVIAHPETGRKALYVSECFTTRIVELSQAESAAVLAVLFAHAQRPEYTMRWKWSAGDIAIWDNRAVQHYAVPDYESGRVMQRIVLQGGRPGEAETKPAGEPLALSG